MLGAQTPLAWIDTLDVSYGATGGWEGFQGSLATATGRGLPPGRDAEGRVRAHADLILIGGSSGHDDSALLLRRGDSLAWMAAGASSWKRGPAGALGDAGSHVNRVAAAWTLGPHHLEAALGNRGAAGSVAGVEEQAARGAGGQLGYSVRVRRHKLGLGVRGSSDQHESAGELLTGSRRDGRELAAWGELQSDSLPWAARLDVRRERVTQNPADGEPVETEAISLWGAARAERPWGAARGSASLGIGRHGGVQRTEMAPSLGFHFAEGPLEARLFLGRVMAPVWSDLAPGQKAFLQSTWAGGFEVAVAGDGSGRARLAWLMGRTTDRALVRRLPLEASWLRSGFHADPTGYDFGLAIAEGEWRGGAWTVGGEAFALLRDASTAQPGVDPATGGRGFAETGFTAFGRDLGVKVRLETEALGRRVSEAPVPRALDGYASLGVGIAATLADAVVLLRVRNLENRRQPEVWVDPLSGLEAPGPGREFRLGIAWRLYN